MTAMTLTVAFGAGLALIDGTLNEVEKKTTPYKGADKRFLLLLQKLRILTAHTLCFSPNKPT